MNHIWTIFLPLFAIGLAVSLRWAISLQFFSHTARDLNQVDIPNEVREVRINELEMLVSDEADWHFQRSWNLTRWQRREVVTRRLRETRKWLRLVIANAALFQEVARFHIQAVGAAGGDFADDDLPFKVMDRASMVHLMAAACLAKLMVVNFCRILWPIYVPELADRFQVKGHDLSAWYRHLANEMLALAQREYDDVTYTRFIFQLTGLFTIEEAARLNRL